MYNEYSISFWNPDNTPAKPEDSDLALYWLQTFNPDVTIEDDKTASYIGEWWDLGDDMYNLSLIFPELVIHSYVFPDLRSTREPNMVYYYQGRYQEAEEIVEWTPFDLSLFTPKEEA